MQNVSVLICRTTPTYFRVVDIYLGIDGEAHNVVNDAELISRQLLGRIEFLMSSVLLIISYIYFSNRVIICYEVIL
jgi:hypothetical protein